MSASEQPLPAPRSAISFELPGWSQIELSGTGAKAFLHNFCTNDVNRLTPGESCEAFVCDIKGKILAHVRIIALANSLRLIGVPGTAAVLCPHLTKYLLDAPVIVTDRSDELELLCLSGDDLENVIREATGKVMNVRTGQTDLLELSGEILLFAGTDMVGDSGILISGKRNTLQAFQEKLSSQPVAQGSSELFEVRRIEAGFPWYGRDIGIEELAQSAARNTQAISFTKGCYLGQEPIARLDAMGHTNREVRGLLIPGKQVSVGDTVRVNEKEVGRITSVADSPSRSAAVALALLRTQHAASGTQVTVRTHAGDVDAQVYWPSVNALSQGST